uniref:Uncharacterized protein n=1 Tax=Heterorhabditis bacteriophora TaxID=37862 RepID=A0A1I7WSP5_HETBA
MTEQVPAKIWSLIGGGIHQSTPSNK